MTNETVKPPVWFWIVSTLALIWNGLGVNAYLSQAFMTDDALAALPEAEQALYNNYPAWATAAFALAVWGGALGSLLLLLRKKLAYLILIISLAGILVQMTHSIFISKAMDVYGPGAVAMPIMVLVVGVALVFIAKKGIASSWLK